MTRNMGKRASARLAAESGFTMIVTLGVMLVTSLLLVAVFAVAENDVHLSRTDTSQKQAYYAALAGVQQYEYKLQANPDYWETCEQPKSNVPAEEHETYEIKLLPASTSKGATECSKTAPFTSMIESQGALANTFRIKSTGYAGTEKRSLIATFRVEGFLNFIYFTNYETLDPGLYSAPAGCANAYYSQWSAKGLGCQAIVFTSGDLVDGPMHTNDAAKVEGTAAFGRKGQSPADKVEINGGTYPEDSGEKCTGSPKFYTANGCYTTKGATLIPPESDTTLGAYVEPAYNFEGATRLVLNGSSNEIKVTRYNSSGTKVEENVGWPANGLIYVQANKKTGCGYKFEAQNADTTKAQEEEKGCGTVYVQGSYSQSLTVAGEDDVVVNGNLYPTSVAGSLGSTPTGTPVMGLIASNYVRVYHPCSGGTNGAGSLKEAYIYAAILSTAHSFINDNWACGTELGKLHVYGAIAQDYRGPVGTTGGTGYIKSYEYDGRLATDEPPYFLAPLKAGWKVIRQTAPTPG
jgi:Tfp pilus assembly protein PilX